MQMNPSQTDAAESSSTTAEADVGASSDRFYAALEAVLNGDAGLMADVLSNEDDVTTMHPIGGREEGWNAVHASIAGVAAACTDGTVTREDQVIHATATLRTNSAPRRRP